MAIYTGDGDGVEDGDKAPDTLQMLTSCLMSANSPDPTRRRVRSANTGAAKPAPRQWCSWRKGPSHRTTTAGASSAAASASANGIQRESEQGPELTAKRLLCVISDCGVISVMCEMQHLLWYALRR